MGDRIVGEQNYPDISHSKRNADDLALPRCCLGIWAWSPFGAGPSNTLWARNIVTHQDLPLMDPWAMLRFDESRHAVPNGLVDAKTPCLA